MRRGLSAAVATLGAAGALAPEADAHGISQRSDLPIPEWLFAWAAAVVLVISFVALASLWPTPRLEGDDWRRLPRALGRAITSPALAVVCGAVGVALLVLVIYSGLLGQQTASGNLAPNFVYVAFWVGLVPISVLFGDVFRAFNPWYAVGRAVAWVSGKVAGQSLPAPLTYPERLGRWPAVIGIALFAWLELVYTDGDVPRTVALASFAYSAVTFVGMSLYGVEAWINRAEAFSVYFNLFARISPWERRGREVGLRRPLAGLAKLDFQPGTVALLAVMIGTVTFDGASEGSLVQSAAPALARGIQGVGLDPGTAVEVAYTAGILLAILLVYGLYRLGVVGARTVGGERSAARLAAALVHTLVPIALVYVAAHYLTLLVFQGQSLVFLASDPLGTGADLFGTAGRAIDYTVLGANTVWYLQVALVLGGHLAALILAHDRALVLYPDGQAAVRSQYWMLGVMIGFTSLALWLLSQVNA